MKYGSAQKRQSLETKQDVSIAIVLLAKWACHGGGVHAEYSLAIMVQSEPKVGE